MGALKRTELRPTVTSRTSSVGSMYSGIRTRSSNSTTSLSSASGLRQPNRRLPSLAVLRAGDADRRSSLGAVISRSVKVSRSLGGGGMAGCLAPADEWHRGRGGWQEPHVGGRGGGG